MKKNIIALSTLLVIAIGLYFLRGLIPDEIPLKQILITSLFIWGMYYATRVKFNRIDQVFEQKEILWFVKFYGDKYLPEWLQKPLYDCPICMASIHSIALAALHFGFSWNLLIIIPAVAGFNYICFRMFPYTE